MPYNQNNALADNFMQQGPYGLRVDGTKKGSGYFGAIKMPDGKSMTELSIGIDFGQGEMEIPLIVPTLSKEDIDHLRSGKRASREIMNKAVQHARERLGGGLSPFK